MEDNHTYWFIIHTKPKQEFLTEKNLSMQGIRSYLPVYRKKVKKRGKRLEVLAPLFSGYLFSQFDINSSYHHVRYTKGVKSILGTDDFLWTMDAEKIADIQSREEEGVVVLKPKQETFRKGDAILIGDGDFEGWEGIFQSELPDHERAVILLTNIRYSSKLVIPINLLRKTRES